MAAARLRASSSRFVPDDANVGRVHDKADTSRLPRDTSLVFVPGKEQNFVGGDPAYADLLSPYSDAAVEPTPTMLGTGTTSDVNRVCIVRDPVEDTGFLSSSEGMMSIAEVRVYAYGRCAH